jgi:23S rRNA pseudouridine2605 synthase
MALQRLQKILAQAGVSSRRSAERLITEGRVRVNGRVISELGARANPIRDRVEVDGKRLVAERPVYYLMHKPRGVVTTLDDPEGRKNVKDLLRAIPERVFPVGRLDFQTSGALLLTNDGAMAQALLHPTRSVPKVYHAKIEGTLDGQRLDLLRAGVTLDDGEQTAPAQVDIVRKDDKHTFIEVTISEGKNRQIHRMLDAVGRVVLRLTRLAFADLGIEGLRPGQLRPLSQSELNDLKQKYLNPGKKVRPRAVGEAFELASDDDGEVEQPVSRQRGGERRPRRVGSGARESTRSSFGERGRVDARGGDPRRQQRGRADARTGEGPRRMQGGAVDARVEGSGRTQQGRGNPRAEDARDEQRGRVDARVEDPRRQQRGRADARGEDPRRMQRGRVDARVEDPRRQQRGRADARTGGDPRRMERGRVDARGDDPRRVQRGRVDARGDDPRRVQRGRVDARVEDPRRVQRGRVDARVEDPRRVQRGRVDARVEDPRRVQRGRVDARVEDPRRVQRGRVDARSVDPRRTQRGGADTRKSEDPRRMQRGRVDARGDDPRRVQRGREDGRAKKRRS